MTLLDCSGCVDDFYNGRNTLGVTRCWNFASARLVKRYRIGTWTVPTTKGAFEETTVPYCYRQKGMHYSEHLPDFVRLADVRRPA